MSLPRTLALSLVLVACTDPPEGTFVGNPTMTARLADNPDQVVTSGEVNALEMLLGDCSQVGDVPLGARVFTFHGALSNEVLQIPEDRYCGIFFVINGFEVRFEQAGEATVVTAEGFDLWIPADFRVQGEDQVRIRFGDEAWLADISAVVGPGEHRVESNAQLAAAFFGGLEDRSAVEPVLPQK